LKGTFDGDDENGKEHSELPSARMLSKIGCRRAKVSKAEQKMFWEQKVVEVKQKKVGDGGAGEKSLFNSTR
jgi:hypothetical protein